jgi:2-keto-4-pentenoate hydratase/2-oxohepta-3-ene-1,7-dioic acid hydratase in catechol pathway
MGGRILKLIMYGEMFEEQPGLLIKDKVYPLSIEKFDYAKSIEMILSDGLLEDISDWVEDGMPGSKPLQLKNCRIGPPITGINKIIAVGLNYRKHAEEMGDKLPANPLLFCKASTTISGPYDDIVLPPVSWSDAVDYEVELGVIIGTVCQDVSVEDALAYVAGYTVVNDLTARDIQKSESQWFRAKSYDGFCPVGPCIITKDELDDVQDLRLTSTVNGEIRQDSNTSDMIFSVAEIISFISKGMTLMPGDLIATGTPSGIGAGFKPPKFLKPGDVVELTVENVGVHKYKVFSDEDYKDGE